MKPLIFGLMALSGSFFAHSGEILNTPPENPNPEGKYVFYSHGYIVEGDDPKPVDKRFGWGLYDFPAIKEALSDDSYTLIATHRAKNTDPYKYAYELNKQVRELVSAGVKPEHITLIGFSRGAFITGLTSDKLSDLEIDTVILAGCGRLVWPGHTDIKVYGDVLSVYETTDKANTCKALKAKSKHTRSFTEINITTGKEHGAFYRPLNEWVKPVKQWIKTRKLK